MIKGLARVPAPPSPFKRKVYDPMYVFFYYPMSDIWWVVQCFVRPNSAAASCDRDYAMHCPRLFVRVGLTPGGAAFLSRPFAMSYQPECGTVSRRRALRGWLPVSFFSALSLPVWEEVPGAGGSMLNQFVLCRYMGPCASEPCLA